ncbi:MAG TPA: tetratricopeptide repeat protein [Bacteroidia bacterium]|nr:tetratricopeptide repeat protein [Bacteroidia bacterium]
MKYLNLILLFIGFTLSAIAQGQQEMITIKANPQPQNLVTIEDFNEALIANPQNTDLYIGRGRAKGLANDLNGAIQDFTKAIELNQNSVPAYYDRATCKLKLKDIEGAIQDYSKAIDIDDKNYLAYYERGNLFFDTKKYKEAS